MAGADESNDDLVSRRVNRANDTTRVWAENQFTGIDIGPIDLGAFRTALNGTVIFQVEVAGVVSLGGPELERGAVSLPRRGRPGDLMTLLDDSQACTLWFCIRGGDGAGPARWAQVLLGPEFPGHA